LKTPADFLDLERWVRTSVSRHVATSTGGIAPETIDRSVDPGNTIGFNFAALLPGTLSDVLVIQTNALAFETGAVTIDGANVERFQPVSSIVKNC